LTGAAVPVEATDGAPLPIAAEVSTSTAAQRDQAEERDDDLVRVLGRLERDGEIDEEGCRLWPESGCNDQGYAVVSMGGRGNKSMPRVYRWLWEREHGPLPKGWTLDHLCHNRAKARGECPGGKCKHRRCCELAHLEAKPHSLHVQQRDVPGDA
jgi:hypothetical protein